MAADQEDLVTAGTGPAAREARRKLKRKAKKSAERADANDASDRPAQLHPANQMANERGALCPCRHHTGFGKYRCGSCERSPTQTL